ncbi:peptidoglycan DD-metalloendopeptidase family protein [Campylobacter sp. RM9344]|uniref:Peptidoglycan DD-metalloendopeptidase family protein n=1 Tax=Campylobacter californiensis TaxID=1032243 RepID=A0AAW3ZW45_9BACT|nr:MULTISPECIES: peptidoglycan DD-metalloendopeptidase family protein [unclassified Campylobacter]MBE2984847.1 peptidoglycan DD-metalloendopeptidase family protein [Campylobacter sp. RM6883]MBE2994687.1 peptidoglycan DD-metalloendopeptidase family protein [Campylobacter sp. RM6913]MBE3030217.1 peptidoglycan DD-metalloendopeptidase family protein [Campylobacter sp. RM9344]MBE3608371.1 peptidoglycan DD-metalloendopeptidase family protein [Campylobacter sp. RM9337]QCD50496.1 zinc metallopeptidase
MRKFLSLLLICALFNLNLEASQTKEKIKSSKTSLRSSEEMSKQLNKKLEDLASDIVSGNKKLRQITNDIANLKEQISALEANATSANSELEKLTKQNKELIQTQKELEQNIIRIIAEDLSFELFLSQDEKSQSTDSIMVSQILTKLNSIVKEDYKKLTKTYEETVNHIKNQSNKIEKIQTSIKNYKQKQNELLALKENQKSTISSLKRDKEIYTKKLAKLQIQQDELRKTLEQLSIMQKREDAKAAELERQRQAQTSKRQGGTKDSNLDVKQMGSSYQTSAVKKYTGAKTIAPLDGFSVKQKFGNYVDPIYNIKIFNESVVLRSNTPNAKVKSVLNGKVVFAKETQLLDRVVIIENENGIHTIYAHLSQIAPTIKVGTRVQKGYVIGRVIDDLTFEVTQKNYHIDPLELISLK